jgi:benzodiazapine receptor
MKDTIRQVTNILATLLVIFVNALANALPLNGQGTGEISDRFNVYFVPAGYVFSIWGLIYLALIGFSIYQALPSQRENPHLQRVGYLYALSCLANSAWIFFWHYEYFELTLVVMVALLLLLIAIYLRLEIGRNRVSAGETWLARVPFSIYLGWITVATIANVTSLLDYLNWSGWGLGPEAWAVIMLIAATIITCLVSITRGDVAYILVIVWAFAGIAVKHSDTPVVAITSVLLAVVVLLALLIGLPLRARRLQEQPIAPSREAPRDRW